MKILVAGFLTIDSIQLPMRQVTSVGGPPSYAGLICARFGHSVTPMTKVGNDFPDEQSVWLARNGIVIRAPDRSATKPTTRFRISDPAGARTLYLSARCEDISASQLVPGTRYDAALVSPLAGEISSPLFGEIASRTDFLFLDPQGFLRVFDREGKVSLSPLKDRGMLAKVDAIKMDSGEAKMITGKDGPKEALEKVAGLGVRKAILTQGGDPCFVLEGNRIYRVEVPKSTVIDPTGAGDVLGGATLSWYLKTRDFLRSACFGIAASALSLHMIALSKVDLPMSVDDTALRLFSLATPVASF